MELANELIDKIYENGDPLKIVVMDSGTLLDFKICMVDGNVNGSTISCEKNVLHNILNILSFMNSLGQ